MTDPTATYLQDLRDIRSTGARVKETSFYPALSNLLNEVGKTLKPKVRCVINLADRGAGLPDGGLFTPDQFQRASQADPLPGQLPSRGAIEIKGTGDDVRKVAESDQVGRYLQKYRQVFVTSEHVARSERRALSARQAARWVRRGSRRDSGTWAAGGWEGQEIGAWVPSGGIGASRILQAGGHRLPIEYRIAPIARCRESCAN